MMCSKSDVTNRDSLGCCDDCCCETAAAAAAAVDSAGYCHWSWAVHGQPKIGQGAWRSMLHRQGCPPVSSSGRRRGRKGSLHHWDRSDHA